MRTAAAADGLADSTLIRIATAQYDTGIADSLPVTGLTIAQHHAVMTMTRPGTANSGPWVYGAIVPVSGLAATLFGAFPREMPAGVTAAHRPVFLHGEDGELHALHADRHRRLVQLDTLGLRIAAGSEAVYGAATDRPYMGTAQLPEPLEEFRVMVSLMSSQVSLAALMPPAHDRLWWNGILILATVVVCGFAIGSSRREVSLARARSDFVAGISHDLRMPLAQILLASETLSLGRERSDKERSSLNASILREARRLKAMVDNVLLFTRSGAVGVEPRLQSVELASLFHSVAESVDLAVRDVGQSIETDASDGLRVVADRGLLHQALVNLVDNAMKYGPTGQRIRIRAERESRRVRIAVEDEGPGIPTSARARLFEPYERLDRDSSSERTGSGLGLAVVRQIVLACNGEVAIEDSPVGTRVVIRLPAAA